MRVRKLTTRDKPPTKTVKPKPKPKKKGIQYASPIQKEACILLKELETAKDPLPWFGKVAEFAGVAFEKRFPASAAVDIASSMQVKVETILHYPVVFDVTCFHQEGKYPNLGPLIRKTGASKHFWLAVAICYLKLCAATNRKH